MATKTKVVLLYGGRSAEHEISCRSAAYVLKNLPADQYDVVAVAIDHEGRWLPQDVAKLRQQADKPLPILSQATMSAMPSLPAAEQNAGTAVTPLMLKGAVENAPADADIVFFPVLHGSFGEDGKIQGLFELAEVAYVGPDTLGSAIGMDKVVAKKLAQSAGVPVVPWLDFRAEVYFENPDHWHQRIQNELGPTYFVKPVCLGSSIGITKVESPSNLPMALTEAFRYDEKVMVETALSVREIECAVLGGYEPEVSLPGEIVAQKEFYDYEAKYLSADGALLKIPAELEPTQVKEAQDLSRKVFKALELYGMARVDLFLENSTGQFYLNEVNTIPGFTEISQFPLLWQHSGMTGPQLIGKLIQLAQQRRDLTRRLSYKRD